MILVDREAWPQQAGNELNPETFTPPSPRRHGHPRFRRSLGAERCSPAVVLKQQRNCALSQTDGGSTENCLKKRVRMDLKPVNA